MFELSSRLSRLSKNPIREIAKLLDIAKTRERIISFGGGSPSLPPASEVLDEFKRMIEEEPFKFSTYTGTRGLLTLREALAEDIKRDTGLALDPENEITTTCGSEEGLMAALMTLLNDGDDVIIANPSYPAYHETVKMVGGNLVWLPTSVSEGFQPDVEKLKALITDKTKAFVINTPDNPTGRMLDKARAKAIVDLAVEKKIWLMIDEAYAHIVYEGSHIWISALSEAFEHSIVYSSFSKVASAPGFRLGYIYGPANVIDAIDMICQYCTICPPTPSQYAITKFLQGDLKYRYLHEYVLPTYRQRRDAMGKSLAKYLPEAKTVKPDAGFFYFADFSSYLEKLEIDDEIFCKNLLEMVDVVAIPGSYFGSQGENHLRLTFVSESPERIEEGFSRMAEYLEKQRIQ